MLFKYFTIILIFSMNLFSSEIYSIQNQLKECKNYNENDSMQQGVFDWIDSVDNIEECNMKQIEFILSNRNRLTVKSNLSLLKSQYEFCDGIMALGNAFDSREFELSKMKRTCNDPMSYTKKKASESHNKQEKFREKLHEHHNNINDLQGKVDKLIDDIYGGEN